MAASLLAEGRFVLHNVPDITDVAIMSELLEAMGVTVVRNGSRLQLDVPLMVNPEAPYELVEQMRASIVVLGPLLARFGRARVALPGGDDFGPRPINMHLGALEQLGATFENDHGYIEGRAEVLLGTDILLEFPSVGATENAMMAAVLAKGRTVIDNAAREPEIGDLAAFLNRMGAQVLGAGTSQIVIEGVDELVAVEHEVIPDRIEAATFLAALGICGGELTLKGARPDHMQMLTTKLGDMGMRISPDADGIWAAAPRRMRSVMLSFADGVGIVTENIFTGRFRYIDELRRMGADIRTEGHHAVVRGQAALSGAPVKAHDIRAGAALVVAALGAEGTTEVSGAEHIDRGYEDLAGKLKSLGADVERR
jgi:UDP-N-acetylglucosamine 1-carboxyvinyltransferase